MATQYNYPNLLAGKHRSGLPASQVTGSALEQVMTRTRSLRTGFCASLMLVFVLVSTVHAQQAETKEEAKKAAVKQLDGDAKALSVEEEEHFFKVKVLADGKVSVVIIQKIPTLGEPPAKTNNE